MTFNKRDAFPAALALALLSGAAGLAHQVLWTRRLVDVLGANADTFSKVIAAFFAGLALGAWWSSRAATPSSNLWKRVAWAELFVAALSIPMLLSGALANWVYGQATIAGGMKLFLPVLLVTPPATAMGVVVPWMVRALATHAGLHRNHTVWLYAVNTLGGILGIAVVVLEALPRLGLMGASLCAMTLNVVVACGAFGLHLKQCRTRGALDTPASTQDSEGVVTAAIPSSKEDSLLAFASGFLVLMLEVILQHQLSQVTINSLYSSAIVLALVLLALTAAALSVPWLLRMAGNVRHALTVALLAALVLCATQPFMLTWLQGGVNILPYELTPLPYTWAVAKVGFVAICPLLIASGFIFPLLLHKTVAAGGARRIGLLFAWNGLGGWIGAELCQSWLAPTFGLWGTMVVVASLYGGLLVWMTFSKTTADEVPRLLRVLGCATVVMVIPAAFWLVRSLPQANVGPNEKLAAVAVGREGVVAVLECGPGDWRMLFNNSYTLGGSQAQFNQERQGLLPLLLHGSPKSVATLGVATGGTVAGVALQPEVERVDAIELSPLVLRHARGFFAPFNREVFRDARMHFMQEDARWVIAGQRAAYDVVVGDLFLPWRTGEARLFTLEHFQNVHRALKPGGLFCQWLPLFQLTRPQFKSIVRTFLQVFPDAFLVRGDFYTELPILGLVGGLNVAQVDWRRIEASCARLRQAGNVTDPLVRHVEGIAMLVVGPLPNPHGGPVNTLANGWVEWDAGHNILGMHTPWFVGVPCAEYIRDIHRAGQSIVPAEVRAAHDAGQFFLTLEIAAKLNLSVLGDLKSQMKERTPLALRNDAGANWEQWPMRLKPTASTNGVAY